VRQEISIFHWNSIPAGTFDEFSQIVRAPNLNLQFESREDDGPFAGVEWLLPTAIIVYISKSYFDGFLKEMGKDHYGLLKKGLNTLHKKLFTPDAPKLVILSTNGKIKDEGKYSRTFSVYAEGNEMLQFKLLLEPELTEEEYEERVSSFMDFLIAYHEGGVSNDTAESTVQARVGRRTILLAYNSDTQTIETVNPIPVKVGDKA